MISRSYMTSHLLTPPPLPLIHSIVPILPLFTHLKNILNSPDPISVWPLWLAFYKTNSESHCINMQKKLDTGR